MRVHCEVEVTQLENEDGFEVEGVVVECSRCSHTTESFGTSSASVRRCLALLREECREGEENFYVSEDDE
jgi:hypothetical protein